MSNNPEMIERISAIISRVVYRHAPIGEAAREILDVFDYQCYGDSDAVEDGAQAEEATEDAQEPGAEEGAGADRSGVRRLDTRAESAAQAEGGDRPHPADADLLPADNGGRSSVLASDVVERVVEVLGRLQIGSSLEEQAVAALEASHHAEAVHLLTRTKGVLGVGYTMAPASLDRLESDINAFLAKIGGAACA
jgi:hypothetical protein